MYGCCTNWCAHQTLSSAQCGAMCDWWSGDCTVHNGVCALCYVWSNIALEEWTLCMFTSQVYYARRTVWSNICGQWSGHYTVHKYTVHSANTCGQWKGHYTMHKYTMQGAQCGAICRWWSGDTQRPHSSSSRLSAMHPTISYPSSPSSPSSGSAWPSSPANTVLGLFLRTKMFLNSLTTPDHHICKIVRVQCIQQYPGHHNDQHEYWMFCNCISFLCLFCSALWTFFMYVGWISHKGSTPTNLTYVPWHTYVGDL